MSSTELVSLYRRFGPVLFSHFLRRLNDENKAMKATRYAFEELVASKRTSERELVAWIRSPDMAAGRGTGLRSALIGDISIDYAKGTLVVESGAASRSFPFPALSTVAQELVVAGGAEAVVAGRLKGPQH